REPAAPHEPLPDEVVARRRRIAAFQRLLERLPEKKRVVFVLHELEGIAPAEIAAIVDAPVLTVRTRLFYARKELCDLMAAEPAFAGLLPELGIDAARATLGGGRSRAGKAGPRASAGGDEGAGEEEP